MTIGIITFHCAINYGAILQTYGLQEYLQSLGHTVYIIDYRPDYLLSQYKYFRPQNHNNLYELSTWFIRELLTTPIKWRRKQNFKKFTKKYLNLKYIDFTQNINTFDTFIFGSDQIWNTNITNGYDPIFTGDFEAAKGKRLVVYGASAGDISNISASLIDYLKNVPYHMIGVREKQLQCFLQQNNIPSQLVLDPILLAGQSTFKKLIKNRKNRHNKYLLLFTLNREGCAIEYANKIAKEHNFKIIEIISAKESLQNYLKIKQTLSPEDFLEYLWNASYIVTTSFHGTAFSILFKKDFNSIIINKNERISSLLHLVNLESRIIYNGDKTINTESINYTTVNKKLDKARKESMLFIKNIQ